jgi:hypothetical protein
MKQTSNTCPEPNCSGLCYHLVSQPRQTYAEVDKPVQDDAKPTQPPADEAGMNDTTDGFEEALTHLYMLAESTDEQFNTELIEHMDDLRRAHREAMIAELEWAKSQAQTINNEKWAEEHYIDLLAERIGEL